MLQSNVIVRFFDSMYSVLGISFILFLLLMACSRVPKGIIPEKKMQQILTDMYLADAIINTDLIFYQNDENIKALYQSVFDKHRVTASIYDSSLVWYGKNLDVYMQVNNMALADVKKRIEKINNIEPEITVSEDFDDIWSVSRYLEFTPTSLSNTHSFSFRGDEDYASGSIFVLGFQVLGLVPGMQSPVEVHLRAEQNDTTIIMNHQTGDNGYHEIILRTLPIPRVKRVYGYIRINNDTVSYHKIYLNNLRMRKYLYGSEEAGKLEDREITE